MPNFQLPERLNRAQRRGSDRPKNHPPGGRGAGAQTPVQLIETQPPHPVGSSKDTADPGDSRLRLLPLADLYLTRRTQPLPEPLVRGRRVLREPDCGLFPCLIARCLRHRVQLPTAPSQSQMERWRDAHTYELLRGEVRSFV